MSESEAGYLAGHLIGWGLLPAMLFGLALFLPPARWLLRLVLFVLAAVFAASLQDIGGDTTHD